MSTQDPTYALGRTAHEHRRLTEQAALLRPLTERLFRSAGIGAGMRVLDVGSGAGDVALLLAELVGPAGEVIGIDLDAGALELARSRAALLGLRNVRFVEGDVRTADLPAPFDAAVGRLVLMYFADPAEALRTVAARVGSGGAIAFHEMVMNAEVAALSASFPADSLWARLADVIIRTFTAAGVHAKMGYQLPCAFLDAGLPYPTVSVESFAGGGESFEGYAWMANTAKSLAPLAAKLGVAIPADLDPDTIADRMREEAVARRLLVMSPPWVAAWARKP
jgi:SAM-dependent methyltransferase